MKDQNVNYQNNEVVMTMTLAANIFVHLLCMNCSKYFTGSIASYPHKD